MAVGDFEAKESSKLSFLLNLMLSINLNDFLQALIPVGLDLPRLGKLILSCRRPTRWRCFLIIGISSRNESTRGTGQRLGGIKENLRVPRQVLQVINGNQELHRKPNQ